MVVKVIPKDSGWIKKVVYTENIRGMTMQEQAARIKELYNLYHPREIIIDGNGIGGGLIDEMVVPSIDKKGVVLPALYVNNDSENYPYPREKKEYAVVYNMKANAQINNDVYSNLYIQFNSGHVYLLAPERIAKERLLATEKGQRMNYYNREKFLLPYIMTSRLIDEINNLKLRPSGVPNQISVEQITKRINKDRVSALGYALYRIKEAEDKALRRNHGKGSNTSMAFFSSKKSRKGE